ncbi:50S ribosomal protein L30 [Candidatus Woesearchaeota archaeon]|nr:50S ribosomal protein L30 [Candidatus Woesearchaeota archaeon]
MIDDIKKIIKEGKAVIGTNDVMKSLKLGKISKVYITINCPDSVKDDIKYYASLSGAEVVQLKQPNDELGIVCKKPFAISVIGLIKGA